MGHLHESKDSNGGVDYGSGDIDAPLVIARKAASLHLPGKSAFDNQPVRQHTDAGFTIGAWNDLDDEVLECQLGPVMLLPPVGR